MVHCPHSLEIPCVTHRKALAVGQDYQSVQYFVQVKNTIRTIYSHFSHSSVCLENLKLVFPVLDMKFVRLKKLYDIRWLSRIEAFEPVAKSYAVLVVHFDEAVTDDPASKGLLKYLTSFKFMLEINSNKLPPN